MSEIGPGGHRVGAVPGGGAAIRQHLEPEQQSAQECQGLRDRGSAPILDVFYTRSNIIRLVQCHRVNYYNIYYHTEGPHRAQYLIRDCIRRLCIIL